MVMTCWATATEIILRQGLTLNVQDRPWSEMRYYPLKMSQDESCVCVLYRHGKIKGILVCGCSQGWMSRGGTLHACYALTSCQCAASASKSFAVQIKLIDLLVF